jgi:hypothetical protein
MAANDHNFRFSERDIFLQRGLDRPNPIEFPREIGVLAHQIFGALSGRPSTLALKNRTVRSRIPPIRRADVKS